MIAKGLVKDDAADCDAKPAEFFKQVCEAFYQAARKTATRERFYSIGGQTLCLRFADDALLPYFTPAFAHLAVKETASPALTVLIWDSTSTATPMPAPPWSSDDYVSRGEVRGFNDARIHTTFHMDTGILSLLDSESDLAVCWAPEAKRIPSYYCSAPLLAILHWWALNRRSLLLHAAAVGTLTGGVLLAGRGGAGKSTSALSCLKANLFYAGDDYCLVERTAVPRVYSLYNSAKLGEESLNKLSHLASAVQNADRAEGEKALLYLHQSHRESLIANFPLRAILLPRVTSAAKTSLMAAPPPAALKALAPSTIFQLPGAGGEVFQAIAQLVKSLPCYYLELGSNLRDIPEVIDQLLREG